MFEHFAKYKAIWVSGPQRSGTRVLSKMIAHDLNWKHIDERDINFTSGPLAKKMRDRFSPCVIHCPCLLVSLPDLCNSRDLAIVSVRNIDDIQKSEQRIGWRDEQTERNRLGGGDVYKDLAIAKAKYLWWEKHKCLIPNTEEIQYETLSGHLLWKEKSERANFEWWQTA